MSTLRASPLTLNAPTPWPPSRSTRGMPAMRALAASCAAEVFTGAEPGAAVPPVDGGGAVRLMHAAPADHRGDRERGGAARSQPGPDGRARRTRQREGRRRHARRLSGFARTGTSPSRPLRFPRTARSIRSRSGHACPSKLLDFIVRAAASVVGVRACKLLRWNERVVRRRRHEPSSNRASIAVICARISRRHRRSRRLQHPGRRHRLPATASWSTAPSTSSGTTSGVASGRRSRRARRATCERELTTSISPAARCPGASARSPTATTPIPPPTARSTGSRVLTADERAQATPRRPRSRSRMSPPAEPI